MQVTIDDYFLVTEAAVEMVREVFSDYCWPDGPHKPAYMVGEDALVKNVCRALVKTKTFPKTELPAMKISTMSSTMLRRMTSRVLRWN